LKINLHKKKKEYVSHKISLYLSYLTYKSA